ncbi:hypothetical protein [Kineococcus sp. SYSU DK005]|uniref:hypothetical protein n=1 Tax=Kineococcus sp. SYSU DK005 TaxID=3383126 RepID=UPI003D7E769F
MTSEVGLSTHADAQREVPRLPGARRGAPAPAPRPPVVLRRARRRVDVLAGLLAALAGLAVFSWRLGTPSPWRDEAVTVAVAGRSAEQVWRLVQHVDLVHAPFYFLVHALFGPSVTVVEARWPSVLAAAATGPLLYGLGRRLALPGAGARAARWAGAAAAGLWVLTPFVSRYAQEARPYALAALVATASTYLLVRARSSPARAGWRTGWWAGYALTLPLLVALNTLALMVLPAQLALLLRAAPAARRRGAAAAGAGLALALPLLWAQSTQQAQVAFLRPPPLRELGAHVVFALGSPAAVAVAALAVATALWRARARRLLAAGLLWGAAPVPLLWALSQVHPLWTTRYLVVVAPGTCLLLASAVTLAGPVRRRGGARLRGWRLRAVRSRAGRLLAGRLRGWRRHGPAVLAVALVASVAVAGLRMQLVFRDPELGHAEDLRGTAAHLAAQARPGDGLLFVPDGEYRYRVLTQLYPGAFAGLRDLALDRPAAESATLVGTTLPPERLAGALAGTRRVWVVGGTGALVTASAQDRETARLLREGFRLVDERDFRAFGVKLYEAVPGPADAAGTGR